MVPFVVGLGDREERRDGAALYDPHTVVVEAPLDVLRTAEVRLDPSADSHQLQGPLIGEHRLRLSVRFDGFRACTAPRQRVDGHALGRDRAVDDLPLPHPVHVRIDGAGHEGLAEGERRLHSGDLAVTGDGVGGEQDAGRQRQDHLLHDHSHLDTPMVDAVPHAVGHCPLGEQRRPAPADVLEDGGKPHDVEVRVVLPGEGSRREVLCGRARSHRVRGRPGEPKHRVRDHTGHVVGHADLFDPATDLRCQRSQSFPVLRLEVLQLVELHVDRRHVGRDPPIGGRRDAEADGHANAVDAGQLRQLGCLAADGGHRCPLDVVQRHHVPLADHEDRLSLSLGVPSGATGRALLSIDLN